MFERQLKELEDRRLIRTVLSRASIPMPVMRIGSRQVINFASNDYLGLAADPGVVEAAAEAVRKYGFGAGASRLLAGGSVLHSRLERSTAAFKRAGAARVFNSGYAANTGIIPAITTEKDIIFSDELNHASIIDGCRLSRAKTIVYRHADLDDLGRLMRKNRGARQFVLTDTVFSMDGDIAPIPGLFRLCRERGAVLYLDDAHATGVLGRGRGALAHFGIAQEPWIIQMGTFSKACGSFGAYCAGAPDVIAWISSTARSLLFSTALPAAAAAASLAALSALRTRPGLVRDLWRKRKMVAEGLTGLGYDIMGSETPIIPVRVKGIDAALRFSRYLFSRGVYVPAIRPPTVREPRLRITVSAAHEEHHIEKLLDLLQRGRKRI